MILFRYLLRGILLRLLIALPSAAAIYLAFDLGDQGRRLARLVGWRPVLEAAVLHLPLIVVQVLPAALLLSLVLWIAQLRRRGELEAVATLGGRRQPLLAPALTVGVLACAGAWLVQELVVPPCEQAADRRYRYLRPSALSGLHRPLPWVRAGSWFFHLGADRRLVALEVDGSSRARQRLEGAFEAHRAGQAPKLRDARQTRFSRDGFSEQSRAPAPVPALGAASPLWRPRRAEAQRFAELDDQLARRARAGQHQRVEVLILHSKAGYPLLNLALALIGVGFASTWRRRSPTRDLALAAAALLAIWALLAICWMLGRSGLLPAALAAWLPVGVATAAGILAARRGTTMACAGDC